MELKVKKIRLALMILILGAGIAALLYALLVPRAVKVEVAKVTQGPFREVIRSDGVLRSKERYVVTAFADGDIKRVTLKVGDLVRKGDIITELLWDLRPAPVRAPIGGVISKVERESAGPVARGQPIVEIVDPAKLEFVADLLTTDAIRLQPGAEVNVENGMGGQTIQARVRRISRAGFTKPSALGVEEERTEVTADLINPPSEILAKMGNAFHVDATFTVREFAQAIKIPVGALIRDGVDWAVYVAQNGRARKTRIEVEALGSSEASIGSGLTVGQQVLVYPGDLVKDGSRLRVQEIQP